MKKNIFFALAFLTCTSPIFADPTNWNNDSADDEDGIHSLRKQYWDDTEKLKQGTPAQTKSASTQAQEMSPKPSLKELTHQKEQEEAEQEKQKRITTLKTEKAEIEQKIREHGDAVTVLEKHNATAKDRIEDAHVEQSAAHSGKWSSMGLTIASTVGTGVVVVFKDALGKMVAIPLGLIAAGSALKCGWDANWYRQKENTHFTEANTRENKINGRNNEIKKHWDNVSPLKERLSEIVEELNKLNSNQETL